MLRSCPSSLVGATKCTSFLKLCPLSDLCCSSTVGFSSFSDGDDDCVDENGETRPLILDLMIEMDDVCTLRDIETNTRRYRPTFNRGRGGKTEGFKVYSRRVVTLCVECKSGSTFPRFLYGNNLKDL